MVAEWDVSLVGTDPFLLICYFGCNHGYSNYPEGLLFLEC